MRKRRHKMKMAKTLVPTFLFVLALALAACGGASPGTGPAQVDLTDLDGLTEAYLRPILFSGATRSTWIDPNNIRANMLVDMYGYMNIWSADIPESEMEFENGTPYYYLDEAILEDYVQSYFDVALGHLRSAYQYHAERKAYAFNMSGVGWAYDPHVKRAEYDTFTEGLTLYLDDGIGEMEGETATLTIQLSKDGSFKYISNEAVPIR